jgi:S-adenosylmethionine synthetase
MTPEKLKAMLTETIAPISARLAKIEGSGALQANTAELVEPHATTLEDIAGAMEAAGVGGGNSKFGHVTALRCMAGSMRREAAAGKIPHAYHDGYSTYASAGASSIAAQVTSAVEAATKPLQDELKAVNDRIAAAQTRVKDLTAKARLTAPAPDRKTLSPDLAALLEGGGIEIGEGNKLQLKH